MVLPFWYRLAWVVQEKGPLNVCVYYDVELNLYKNVGMTFFFCMLKLSMMTPMKRLSVKKEPKTMKKTK